MRRMLGLSISNVEFLSAEDDRVLLSLDSLELAAGSVYGVVAPNLSGRSILLRLLGDAALAGSPRSRIGEKRIAWESGTSPLGADAPGIYLGPCPQDSVSTLTATVEEELALHRKARYGDIAGPFSANTDLVDALMLSACLKQDPLCLSGGQTAALALLCALEMKRPILCVDETLAHLDVSLRPVAWRAVREFARAGHICLMADNEYDLMAEYADYAIILDGGQVKGIHRVDQAFNSVEAKLRGTIPSVTSLTASICPQLEALPVRYEQMVSLLRASPNGFRKSRVPEIGNDARKTQDIAPGGESSLVFDGLCFTYPGSDGRPALAEASAALPLGHTTGLIGSIGAGKSTLCKTLNGVLRAQRGGITFGGKPVAPFGHPGQLVAYSFQNPDDQLFQDTVEKEVAFGPRCLGLTPSEISAGVSIACDLFGLASLKRAHPLDLPFVLRKRVAMAAAVAMQRPFTVLDEPTVTQDQSFRAHLLDVIECLTGQGRSLILISHDAEFAFEACDRILVMSQGRCCWSGTREEFCAGRPDEAEGFVNLAVRLSGELDFSPVCPTRQALTDRLRSQRFGRSSFQPGEHGCDSGDDGPP